MQKSGIDLKDLDNFFNYCTNDLLLNIIGLMCMPPINSNSNYIITIIFKYFLINNLSLYFQCYLI